MGAKDKFVADLDNSRRVHNVINRTRGYFAVYLNGMVKNYVVLHCKLKLIFHVSPCI
jgi:hypothetical protein